MSQVLKEVNKIQRLHNSPRVYLSKDDSPLSMKEMLNMFKRQIDPNQRDRKKLRRFIKLTKDIDTVRFCNY